MSHRKFGRAPFVWLGVGALVAVSVVGPLVWLHYGSQSNPAATQNAAGVAGVPNTVDTNPSVDTGSNLRGVRAPGFALTNQFGRPASLQQFRGKVVLLAFVDSECTTICPLTTASMVDAVRTLGPAAAAHVQLVGVNANPQATSVADVRAYSITHGIMFRWQFLTGSKKQLEQVWHAYHMYSAVVHGQVDHTPGLFLIDQQGRERRLYMTQMAFSGVAAQGQIMARAVSGLLPAGVARPTHITLPSLLPALPATLPTAQTVADKTAGNMNGVSQIGGSNASSGGKGAVAHGGTTGIRLAGSAHLLVFFATWLAEQGNLAKPLAAVQKYATAAGGLHLPRPVLIDELPTEPSPAVLAPFLRGAGPQIARMTAVDTTGEAADAVGVQGLPWITLVSSQGKVLWSHSGWLSAPVLQRLVQRAMNRHS